MSGFMNLDDELGPLIAENVAKAPIHTFIFGGREWHCSDSASQAGALFLIDENGEVDGVKALKYTLSFIVDEERADFDRMLAGTRGLDINTLGKLTDRIYELVTGNPTEPPSVLPPSPAKKAGPRSTAKSSSRAIAGVRTA